MFDQIGGACGVDFVEGFFGVWSGVVELVGAGGEVDNGVDVLQGGLPVGGGMNVADL